MMEMNCETDYRLQNCGLRLAAGAGSAIGAKRTSLGYNRAYVRAGVNPTVDDFLRARREGRNFVTNGPMLFLRTETGFLSGDTIDLPAGGGEVTFHLHAISDQRLQSLELIVNGAVKGRAALSPSQQQAELTVTLVLEEGSWAAARCRDEDGLLSDEELASHRQERSLPTELTPLRYAHTSPIYVSVGGESVRVGASAVEAWKTLSAFRRFARERAAPQHLDEILDVIPATLGGASRETAR